MFPILLALFASTTPITQILPSQPYFNPIVLIAEEAKAEVIATSTSVHGMISFYAEKYKVSSSTMSATIKCESNYRPDAVNWNDTHANSKGSHGVAQFSKETIKGFGKEIGIENPDPYNPEQAIEIMAYMFSKGKMNHWTCFRLVNDG